MTTDKLNKYKKRNFELKSKHIYAKKKLENIRDYILLSHNLVGGDVSEEIKNLINNDNINQKSSINDKLKYFNELQKKIIESMKYEPKLLIKDSDPQFKNIMEADNNIVKVFDDFTKINTVSDSNGVSKLLFNIQKSLFNLQAKIIFSSLKNVEDVDVKPLLFVIEQKINAMNDYIEKQEKLFDNPKNGNSDNITYKNFDYNNYNKVKTPEYKKKEVKAPEDNTLEDKAPEDNTLEGKDEDEDKAKAKDKLYELINESKLDLESLIKDKSNDNIINYDLKKKIIDKINKLKLMDKYEESKNEILNEEHKNEDAMTNENMSNIISDIISKL